MVEVESLLDKIKNADESKMDDALIAHLDKQGTRLAELFGILQIADHYAILDLLKKYREVVEVTNNLLLNKRNIGEWEREVMIEKRDMYAGFIKAFDRAELEKEMEQIEQDIDQYDI